MEPVVDKMTEELFETEIGAVTTAVPLIVNGHASVPSPTTTLEPAATNCPELVVTVGLGEFRILKIALPFVNIVALGIAPPLVPSGLEFQLLARVKSRLPAEPEYQLAVVTNAALAPVIAPSVAETITVALLPSNVTDVAVTTLVY